jgi:hypothetical protein
MKMPAKKKASTQAKPKAARDYFPPVAPDDPIYQSGYVVGGRYPARKPAKLDKIADKLATERNADPSDEDIQRDAVFQAAAERARAVQPTPTGFAAQLSQTIEDVLTEVDDEAARQVLEQFQRNLTGKENPAKTPRPLPASQLANRDGLEPTTMANLNASQAKLKATGRDLTLEEVYALESDQPA